MKKKLIAMRGLPACGKSTLAFEYVKQGYKRVNKDDLRAMIDDGKWSKDNEKRVKDLEKSMVFGFLRDGFNVVVDDTNFGYELEWELVAKTCNADFELVNFDILPEECVKRDAKRGDKSVGAEVIYRMYNKYVRPKNVPYNPLIASDCYIFDIDGTLAIMADRSPYDYTRVSEDTVNENVASIFDALSKTEASMIIMSGRQENCRAETEEWLRENDINYNKLLMRPYDDKRKDSEVKKELYEQNIKGKYNVLGVYDDRNQVVEMWRHEGLTCFQVNYGFF